jgi:glycopeptide antibiotics resistance protein
MPFAFSIGNREPLKPFYPKIFCFYSIILVFITLWPFNFSFLKRNNVKWDKNTHSVIFENGQIISKGPSKTLYDYFQSGTGLSIELWVSSLNENQNGPARIISYSIDPFQRNFTVAQDEDRLIVRLRTVHSDINAIYPHVEVSKVFNSRSVRHIVVTYDFKEECIFIDGQLRSREKRLTGGFDNWDSSHLLVFGNEATGNRPWVGRIFLVAFYNRPIDKNTVWEHYSRGWRMDLKNNLDFKCDDGLIGRYRFTEGEGKRVRDSSCYSKPIDLIIPNAIHDRSKVYLEMGWKFASLKMDNLTDFIFNIIAFIPFGFFFHAFLRSKYWLSIKVSSAVVLILGGTFTFGIESMQYFLDSRYSSMSDVIANFTGTALGVACDYFFDTWILKGRHASGVVE